MEEIDWKICGEWAKEFTVPQAWVERGVAACYAAGVSPLYFRGRYLLRDGTPMIVLVDKIFRRAHHGIEPGECDEGDFSPEEWEMLYG